MKGRHGRGYEHPPTTGAQLGCMLIGGRTKYTSCSLLMGQRRHEKSQQFCSFIQRRNQCL